MKVLYHRPALTLSCLVGLLGVGNIIMCAIYSVQPSIETVRTQLGATVFFLAVDTVYLIISHFVGGSDE